MDRTLEKSQEQAEIIKMIAFPIQMLDVEYCIAAANDLIDQAHRQESMVVLNPNYPRSKNELIQMQGKALRKLCEYVEALKEIEKLKLQVIEEENTKEKINKLFI